MKWMDGPTEEQEQQQVAALRALDELYSPENFPPEAVCMASAMTVYGYDWASSMDVADYMLQALEFDGFVIRKVEQ